MTGEFFGAFGDAISFKTMDECLQSCSQLAWRPANLEEWRKNQNAEERHIISLFLRWRFSQGAADVRCPLTVTRLGNENEPDFCVTEGIQSYGLEVTQATTERLQSATTQLFRSESAMWMELGPELNIEHQARRWNPREPLLSKGERCVSEGWIGMAPEIEWADICMHAICAKMAKLRDRYQACYPICDLLIYSSTHTPLVDLRAAISFLQIRAAGCRELVEAKTTFRTVAIVAESWAIFDALQESPKIAMKEGWPFVDEEDPLPAIAALKRAIRNAGDR